MDDATFPEPLKRELNSGQITAQSISKAIAELAAAEHTMVREMETETRFAFARAVTHNYMIIWYIVLTALFVTFFVPQLPLRKTNAPVLAE